MKPLPQQFETSLIRNVEPGKRIYPSSYNRRFNINTEDVVAIMKKLKNRSVVKLRFQIKVNNETLPMMYDLKSLPSTYYDEDTGNEMLLNSENYVPVYEVLECPMKE